MFFAGKLPSAFIRSQVAPSFPWFPKGLGGFLTSCRANSCFRWKKICTKHDSGPALPVGVCSTFLFGCFPGCLCVVLLQLDLLVEFSFVPTSHSPDPNQRTHHGKVGVWLPARTHSKRKNKAPRRVPQWCGNPRRKNNLHNSP